MAGTFVIGEEKIRPGSYFNISRNDNNTSADIVSGVTAVIFKSDFGPLLDVRRLNADADYGSIYGTGLTTDAIKEAVAGGAKEIIACRVGHGGTNASIDLNGKDGEAAVKISAMYPGDKGFAVTIREKITDASIKECIIYTGIKEFVKFTFPAGEGEAAAGKVRKFCCVTCEWKGKSGTCECLPGSVYERNEPRGHYGGLL